ncbi:MAG: carbonic anhydrase [Panacagrimonas sp.]|nr:carbonic anhydrase [Panacagrimonas sp.]MCC2655273.1 carbonic anhydrase [Panacagrimonas sp.]
MLGTIMISAPESLERLRDGNRRFVLGLQNPESVPPARQRAQFVTGQQPFAVVLGCSDSRVPVEIVFDQGLGDLFVIRNAGNIVAPSVVGSVEFAVDRFETRLVVVMGHSLCGAVGATLETLQARNTPGSPSLLSIVDRIVPAVRELMDTPLRDDPRALYHHAVRANVRASANQLRRGSAIIEQMIERCGLMIVGAEYSLETGLVDFFDGVGP